MQDLKPERAVESDRSWHFVDAQCNRADPLDHGRNSPVLIPCAVCSRHFSTGRNKAGCATHRLTAASWIDWISNIRNVRSRFTYPNGLRLRVSTTKQRLHQLCGRVFLAFV